MKDLYKSCELCPRKCKVDRHASRGFCGESDKLRICRASLHMWEEPCISGREGSGTIFFTGCQLKCIYCQNSDIALSHAGLEISEERLIEIFFELAEKGANNINLVTPSHFTPTIVSAIDRAKATGITLPFLWNSSGYEELETLELLRGKIDIFLPDFKYFSPELAESLSYAPDYFEKATAAIRKMLDIAGKSEFDEHGLMKKGVIVRHLILPAHTGDSMNVIQHLFDSFGHDIYISIMNQYTPMPSVAGRKDLSRRLTTYEYEKVVNFAANLGIVNGFTQRRGTARDSFIPAFDYTGVLKND
ncbi:MAG: radical SAM protein [Ruminococcaceae bacterium]|nr:radical SAM protein [Oscillospiraceae bacterium]